MSAASSTSTSFEALLSEADALRSADGKSFAALLEQLDAKVEQATPLQRQHLRYLHTYRMARAGDFDGAIGELKRLFEEVDDVPLKFRAGAFLVNNFAATRDFSEGLGYLDRTLKLLPGVTDSETRHGGLLGAAILYNQVGQYDLALDHLDAILAEASSGRTRCMAEYLRIEALFNRGDLASSEATFAEQIERCRAQGELLVAGFMRGYQARKWAADGRQDDAARLLRDNLPEIEATSYPRLIGEIHSLLAEYELAQGHIDNAESHAQRAIALSSAIEFSLPLVMAYHVLYESALRRNDIPAALDHYRSYSRADKAFLDATEAREQAVQLVRQETLQKNQTIELLNRRNQVLQLEQQVSKQATTNTRLLLALALVLLASIGFWGYKTKRMHAALKQLAETDALTAVSSRHHFTEVATAMLQRGARDGTSVALITFDLDHFKLINDHYGHATGDWVLRQVADVCRPKIAANACFGRIGGEEFSVIVDAAGVDAGRDLALSLRESISAIDLPANGASLKVGASFGVSSTAHSGYSLDRLMAQADEVLYASKNGGRNCVSIYPPAVEAAASATSCASQVF
jgi:diguanylate cyclase (GGDEF)-like protein